MTARIDWVAESCRLLAAIGGEFDETQPFSRMTIGTGIHLEPKTAVLLATLQRGGARVIATGNLNSTQPSTVDWVTQRGVEVIGSTTRDLDQQDLNLRSILAAQPDLILDNGGDLFARYLDEPYEGLLGGTEETTSGRARLAGIRHRFTVPILVINDSPIKQFAENEHAVGQSVLESFFRITNRSTQGKRVVVFGYGACGRGVAVNFRSAFSLVSVIETDPVKRLQASFDGFDVSDRDDALETADVVITVTGADSVVTAADLEFLKDDVILLNAGHFPREISVDEIQSDARVESINDSTPGLATVTLVDGRRVHIAAHGHMVNLAGPHPLGNSIESMDLGFALQARCLESIALGRASTGSVVVPVPRTIDEKVARDYLKLVGAIGAQ